MGRKRWFVIAEQEFAQQVGNRKVWERGIVVHSAQLKLSLVLDLANYCNNLKGLEWMQSSGVEFAFCNPGSTRNQSTAQLGVCCCTA